MASFLYEVETSILKKFGSKVRLLRVQRNLTQEKLAEITDLHPTYIGRVERGERNLSLKNIEVFANAFGVPIEELFI